MPPIAAAVIALVGLVLVFGAVWAWQVKSENAGMVDPVWAYSLGAVAVLYAVLGTGDSPTRALAALGGLIWGARLGTHLWRRNFGQPEDARYRRFREEWGDAAPRRMFWFFQLQVVISMLLSVAFLAPSYRSSEPATGWILLAVAIWIVSVGGEGLADRQLRRFKNDPSNHGKVCREGLWRYSRHPNYFFECVHWVSYIALSIGSPWIWLTFLPPVLMAWLLLKLSGIPLLEASLAKTRAGYAEYMRTTNALIPWPPAAPGDGWLIRCCERGWLPDPLIRLGMRQLMGQRLRDEAIHNGEFRAQRLNRLLDDLRSSPIAIETQAANTQHYEVPAAFFHAHLGPHLKYSCCLYPEGKETLAQAETAMLELYAARAELADGQRVLDLGCGWGSLSLWLAARYPNSRIVALSNSHGQRAFIEACAAERGLTNLKVVTGNIVDFEFSEAQLAGGFDRVVSIEMFEHMKNYGLLLAKIARWMRDDAKLFVHIFVHRTLAYHFQVEDGSDWMSKYFFTGGTMPSENLLLHFQDDLRMERQWWVSGTHYERTANQWLAALDAAKDRVMPLLVDTYGARDAAIWLQRWRMFYMAVAELFGYANGNEWGVGHYRFEKR